jgi:16S rRNA (cytosine967-C5)-methyltransferase
VSDTAAAVLTQAARALAAVAMGGRSGDEALSQASASNPIGPAVRAVTLGSLRWYWRLDALATALIGQTRLVPALRALLVVALHQLEYSRNPPEVTVCSAVDAVRTLRQPRAAGLMNALLRRFLRERTTLSETALKNEAAANAHPAWLFAALRQAWPDDWRQVVASNNAHPPFTLRANLSRVALEAYQAQLARQGLMARTLSWSPTALVLEQPLAVSELPGFADGLASVQDAGAQLASALLGANGRERVLDACAAPGGKSGAILESAGTGLALTAVDVDAVRMQRVADNLRRLKLQATLVTADLSGAASWWNGEPFDRILLDAPCSATGVIRRHPDIKLLRRPQDIAVFALLQRRILRHCLGLLRPGGRLLYSTCSLLAEENERVVEATLSELPRARLQPLPSQVLLPPNVRSCSSGIQLLPGDAAPTDGFYYACLTVT